MIAVFMFRVPIVERLGYSIARTFYCLCNDTLLLGNHPTNFNVLVFFAYNCGVRLCVPQSITWNIYYILLAKVLSNYVHQNMDI